jgi:hypothetical protein
MDILCISSMIILLKYEELGIWARATSQSKDRSHKGYELALGSSLNPQNTLPQSFLFFPTNKFSFVRVLSPHRRIPRDFGPKPWANLNLQELQHFGALGFGSSNNNTLGFSRTSNP